MQPTPFTGIGSPPEDIYRTRGAAGGNGDPDLMAAPETARQRPATITDSTRTYQADMQVCTVWSQGV
ncbi:hypothetical protein ACFCYC_08850 [Streptomyces sp. NPDC056402]|uniref:hypothetical protein n=1 Tax=Streptomyces sp. NPDC056402 TaxID=3345810 RepID=UPI0035DAE690